MDTETYMFNDLLRDAENGFLGQDSDIFSVQYSGPPALTDKIFDNGQTDVNFLSGMFHPHWVFIITVVIPEFHFDFDDMCDVNNAESDDNKSPAVYNESSGETETTWLDTDSSGYYSGSADSPSSSLENASPKSSDDCLAVPSRKRKQDQNKEAARRYRSKKKKEMEYLEDEEQMLQSTNASLKQDVMQLEAKLSVLKELLSAQYGLSPDTDFVVVEMDELQFSV